MRNTAKLMTVVVALSAASVFAADWPWIYGPTGNSTSDQKGLLRTWPEAGPKVLWTAPMGAGFGGPAAPDGRRRARLHLRAARRPVRHQHQDAETRLAQEHLEGLRRRRPAPVGDR